MISRKKTGSDSPNRGWTWASQHGLYHTASWRRLRKSVITDEPLCRMCKSMKEYVPAVMVDHIIAITEKNWQDLFLNRDNLQPLCDKCHLFKTQRDKRHGSCDNISIEEILKL